MGKPEPLGGNMSRRFNRVSLIAFLSLLIPIIAFIFILLSIVIAWNWFVLTKHALSNLGAVSANSHIVFNSGLMVEGLVIIALSLMLILEFWKERKVMSVPTILLLLSGIALFGIGLFPMDITPIQHLYCSIAFFALLGFTMLGFGICYSYRGDRVLGILGVLAFIIDIIAWLFVPWREFGIEGVAIPEITSFTLPLIWLMIFSVKTIRTHRVP